MTTKTSKTDPIFVNQVDTGAAHQRGETGRIGLTICPGKKADGIFGHWDRDLDTDLEQLKADGWNELVTLLPQKDLDMLNVPNLLERAKDAGFLVRHFGFIDGGIPEETIEEVDGFITQLVEDFKAGGHLVIHCRGGLGRSGLVAACMLLKLGIEDNAADAIARVRRARRGAVETDAQEKFIADYAAWLKEHR